MSYRLKRRNDPGEEMRRIGLEQIERAVAEITDPGQPSAERIHAVRKRFKKLRSLFRLARGIDPEMSRHEDRRFRRMGSELSALRDNDVLLSTLKTVSKPNAEKPAASVQIEDLHRTLNAQHLRDIQSRASQHDPLRTVELQLQSAKEALLVWHPPECDYADLVDKLTKQYRKGRTAFRQARRDLSAENMHELRKRTKDYGYQLKLLQEFRSGSVVRRLKLIEQAGLLLGQVHDLSLLAERVHEKLRETPRHPARLKALRRRVERHQRRMEKKCLTLCEKLYRDRTRAFAKRFSAKKLAKSPA